MGFWWKVLSTGASWVFSLVILGLGQGTAQTLRETDDLFHPLPQWQSVKHASPYPVSAEDVFTMAFFLLTGELQCKREWGLVVGCVCVGRGPGVQVFYTGETVHKALHLSHCPLLSSE